MTAEEITKQLEALMAEQEKEEKVIVQRIAALRDTQYRQTQIVHDLRRQEQALQADIQGMGSRRNEALQTKLSDDVAARK